ncbi:MAG: RNA polymerase sigma factor [Solirubrobacteraceae bacterium]
MSRTTRPPECSEQELVAATRTGDDRAFEELYSRYRDRVFSFILSKVRDHGRAEDIAQDVFMSALRRLRRSDQAIAFKPWIYEIAKNACIDEFRRGSRAREVPLESDGEFVVDRRPAALSAVPTPPAAVESKQRLDHLRGAFGGLSAEHHQLLLMREFEGLSYDQIGDRLGMTRQMVESSMFRARRKLTAEYQELASGQRCEQTQTAIDAGRLRSAKGLGIRDRRRFARHLSDCQLCRHAALMAGVDEALVKPRSIRTKIGALLPFPLWRLSWRSRGARTASAGGSHQVAGAGAGLVPSAGAALTLGQAAATVAVIVAGAGGALAVNGLASSGHTHPPATVTTTGHTGRQPASSSAGAAAASAAGAKAAHARGTVLSKGATAISSGSSTGTGSKSVTTRRRNQGSAPGAPGGGGSGSTSSTGSNATSAGSGPGGTVTRTVNGVARTVNGVARTVNGVTKTVSGVTNTVGKTVNGVAGGAGQAANRATNGVAQAVGGVTSGTSNTVSGVTNGASKTVGGVTGGLTGSSGGSSSSSGSSGSTSPAPVSPGVSNTVSTATQTVTSGVQQVTPIPGH